MKRYETNGMYGKAGEYEPRLCAITALALQSGHVSYQMGDGYYFSVNPLVADKVDDKFIEVMRKSVEQPKAKRTTKAQTGE